MGAAARIQARPLLGGLSLRALSLSAPLARSNKVPEEPAGAPHDAPPADALLERAALGAASAGPAAASSDPPKLHPNYGRLPMPDPLPARVEGKRVVVGTDFLKTLAKGGFIVDKSLACKALLESPNEAMRICLPRRFGKSFNLSVITQFFNPITTHDCVPGAGARDFTAAYTRRRQPFSGSLLQERHPAFFDEHFAAIPVIHLNFKSTGFLKTIRGV
ncbi:hypothetical protein H4R18_005084 [Coemansia javaensis]|uniref:AAA-ATPase-like domain-containing protein n=1 Tax=Coemansia javaensis TaxID=2761396 RepID=A0A9W8H3S1_9FUNG|nr:hypothetical protein H4R18_005084 [Coemansia javaensis]